MKVEFDLQALGEIRWYEFAIRILFGGLITVIAGVIAGRFGPAIGGLFLAFPAILPASATLVEKHAIQEREKAGCADGTIRGRNISSLDARGAAMGTVGLAAFALVVWKFLDDYPAWLILPLATLVWLLVCDSIWRVQKMI